VKVFGPFVLLSFLAGIAAAAEGPQSTPAATSIAQLQQQLEAALRETHTPGMSLAIVRASGPEWVAGLGIADVASGTPSTSQTLFRIGSTSKAFTSLAILQLADAGKLSLQDPVRKLVPEVWFENKWEATDPVRVVDLLEHTTGWDDMHLREYAKNAAGMTLADGLNYDHHSRISRWRPGTRMAYCNSGPAVAAAIVEKLTGQRFEDYVSQHLFGPIGMKTATYLPPQGVPATTLYHADGKTPFAYWHILVRPAGAINASAEDMAPYVQMYLNRGLVGDTRIIPAELVDRMEVPTRNWAAQDGLKAGYGLSNYVGIHDGFVYHGHDGGVNGGLTVLSYLPQYGVGYFVSINTGNGAAFQRLGKIIRGYVTQGLARPELPPAANMPTGAQAYDGWYEPDSPRNEMAAFLERIIGIVRVRIGDGRMTFTGADQKSEIFVPVVAGQLRRDNAPDHLEPIAAAELVSPKPEGLFIVAHRDTFKKLPTWLALAEMFLTAWFAVAATAILAYAPFWLIGGLFRKRRRPKERAMRLWPLVAVLSLVSCVAIVAVVSEDLVDALGKPSPASIALFAATLLFGLASVVSGFAVWRARAGEVRRGVRVHAILVTIPLLIATAYLGYWGVIGLRTWA
jgi:CubicO group peptidase (beta-lactamase class C family)